MFFSNTLLNWSEWSLNLGLIILVGMRDGMNIYFISYVKRETALVRNME